MPGACIDDDGGVDGSLELGSRFNSLIIYPPDDTASNLDPGDRTAAGFPQYRHGSVRLTGLFNNPGVIE